MGIRREKFYTKYSKGKNRVGSEYLIVYYSVISQKRKTIKGLSKLFREKQKIAWSSW